MPVAWKLQHSCMLSAATIRLLRIPFSFFLSPLYFFSLSEVPEINWLNALLILVILHFLVYPASNGYNSYMDRDTESIGGIEKPPPPSKQLYFTTIVLDIVALLLGLLISPVFSLLLVVYISASKAYSYRGTRLKRFPVTGYLTVIVFQGAFTCLLVFYGSNIQQLADVPWEGMLICALLIGGFYPLTQVYQHRQDVEDGVTTISYQLGYNGTFIFCAFVCLAAWVVMAIHFLSTHAWDKLLIITVFFIPIIYYFFRWFALVRKDTAAANFRNTMTMNWLAATCTNTAFFILLSRRFFE
jgi:1,4-dihydroxy-2-naphthoate octaprenyltransferase